MTYVNLRKVREQGQHTVLAHSTLATISIHAPIYFKDFESHHLADDSLATRKNSNKTTNFRPRKGPGWM